MSNIVFKDGYGQEKVRKATGEGTIADPYVASNILDGGLPDTSANDLAHIHANTNNIGLDLGPGWTVVSKYTTSADMTTAAPIVNMPVSGQKIVADDIIISTDTTMVFTVQMETSETVLTAVKVTANYPFAWSPRNGLRGDAIDKRLYGKASTSGNVYITVLWHSEL